MHDTVVTTASGQVEGCGGNGVCVWKGIPYAAPPVGNLRFSRTQKIKPWNGVREAKRFSRSCPQPSRKNMVMDEDCLLYTSRCV